MAKRPHRTAPTWESAQSTAVELLQGQRSRDAGTVSVLASADRRRRSRIGVVRRDESAPVELTVREAVAHVARSCPQPRDATDVFAMVGLERYADTRIKAFSGGRRRRPDGTLGAITTLCARPADRAGTEESVDQASFCWISATSASSATGCCSPDSMSLS
ncbi:hypothetical protein AB0N06_02740 [Streptomyces sp. NPDC051020]|uniref:ATP-binding cassette domain-containing protein n=1 Tax=Streptomyces sp. NPDC051020 TaxID=3155409 RepID=UPI00341EA562